MKHIPRTAGRSVAAASSAGDELWELLIEFSLTQRVWWTEVCDGLGLTTTQGLALRLLDPQMPKAMNALTDNMFCDASNVTGVVDKLEGRGLIERRAAENGRRVKILAVTEKGRALREKLSAALRALVAERNGFSAAE